LKITFQFNSKLSEQGVHDSISIAQKCKGNLEGKLFKVRFDTPEDINLNKLIEFVGHLKGSLIIIDNEEGVVVSKFLNTFNCQNKLLCNGICDHATIGNHPLENFNIHYSQNIENNVLTTENNRIISSLSNFLDEVEPNHFKLNKELLIKNFLESTKFERKFCSKYNEQIIKSEIEKLPN